MTDTDNLLTVYDVLGERAPSDADIENSTDDATWWLRLRDATDALWAEVARLQAVLDDHDQARAEAEAYADHRTATAPQPSPTEGP